MGKRKRPGRETGEKPETKGGRQQRITRAKLAERRTRLRKWAILAVALVLAVGLSAYLLLPQRGPDSRGRAGDLADRPVIKVTPQVYDFGTVSQARGVVAAEVTVENRGTGELVIDGMRTSCGCTRASLVIAGQEGPLFGMHDNPVGWKARLAPGERAQLRIYYDPNVHGQLRGPVTREIEIYSNDPQNPVYTVTIRLVQTD